MNSESAEALASFIGSAAGVGVMLLHARRAGVLDFPNIRSSHSIPTPRGGGLALVLTVLCVSGYEVTRAGLPHPQVMGELGILVLALALVGWLDDMTFTAIMVRAPVQLVCALGVGMLVNSIAPVPGVANLAWLVWWVFWTSASINIVNFMDGIDGMIACQGIVYGAFLHTLLPGELFGSVFGLILAAACAGFLIWNWNPAKMFMGDAGSAPLGVLFAIGGALALEGADAVLVFLPLFPLFLDALLTLILRRRRGETLTEAHRSHLYQRVANGGIGHPVVTLTYAFAAIVGALIAVEVRHAAGAQTAGAIAVYVLAVIGAWAAADSRFPNSDPVRSIAKG